jgi:sulfate adenylyltransferase
MTDATTRVLTDDELDLLELALGGAVPATALAAGLGLAPVGQPGGQPGGLPGGLPGGGTLVLTDTENTPLAALGPDAGTLEPLKPVAAALGPQWDPSVRRPAHEVRAETTGGALALVVPEVPTREDADAAVRLAHGAGDVLVLVPAARRVPEPGTVGAAGLVRAATALAGRLAEGSTGRVRTVVLPWSGLGPATLDDAARAYGADRVESLLAHRTAATAERLAALPGLHDAEVARLYPDASAAELERAAIGAHRRGAVVFFTGLSGSGKSTVARALAAELDDDGLQTTLLDGDAVRHHLSKGLGFDKASRELNVERIGYVAALVAKHGGIAVAAPIAPFASGRARVRALAEEAGAHFVLVHVSTPLEVCEARDRKGFYAKARSGEIAEFTGISSPYEEPTDAELVIDTSQVSVEEAVRRVRDDLATRLGG